MLWLLLGTPALALSASRDFDIAEAPAAQGVTRFAQQAGVPVLFPYDLMQGRRTAALQGRLEIDVGLKALLAGSGLVAQTNRRGQITLRLAERVPNHAPAERTGGTPALSDEDFDLPDVLPEVAITGTRIERDGMMSPTPVAAITSLELASMGPTTLVDALVQLPHFLNNDTPQTQSFGTSGAAGASHLNLRGIGSIRTLTLLDGRRTVPSTRFGTVDIALFPRNLLRRVDVVTGGASAAYGSDAVSGVVNMILDSDFRGLNTQAQAGLADRGDYFNSEFSATFGTRVGDQSSLLLSAELFNAQGIRGYQGRDWFDSSAAIANPDPAGPREILSRNVHATGYTYGGLITSGPLAGTQFLEGGLPAPFVRGTLYTNVTQAGGSGVDPAADLVWILPDQQRASAFARFTTQPTAAASFFAQLLAGRTRNVFDKDPPSLWSSWEATIFADNAFLPQSIRDQMSTLGLASFRMGRVAVDGELGRGKVTGTGELLSTTLGFDWNLADWTLDGYYQWGRNLTTLDFDDVLRVDRIYRGIDSVVSPQSGQIVCRSTLSFPDDGCVPVNLFGRGAVSDAARDYVTEGSSSQVQDVREQVADVTLRRDLSLLPAGPMSLAAGLSWREESVDSQPRRFPESLMGLRVESASSQGYRGLPAAYLNASNIFERTAVADVAGRYSVWEGFGEVMLPLLRDMPLAQRLDLHAALRLARYSGSGAIPAWKLGLDWQPMPDLRLRATRSRDVRAGSLSERYDVGLSGITIVDRVLANAPVYAVVAQRIGNPQIEPEKADTTTAGFVLRPSWVNGFSLSADYYDIRIRDAIAVYGVQAIIDGCAERDAALCDLITRNDTTRFITRVRNLVLNVAQARSRGIDLEMSWRGPVQWFGGGESLALRLFANHALESSTIGGAGEKIDRAGQTGLFGGAPRLQANLSVAYERGPWRFTLQERYISSGSYNATYGPADLDKRRVNSVGYTSLRVGWQPAYRLGASIYLNIQNLFDVNPPRSGDWGFGGSIPTNEGLFDVLGRRYVLGVRIDR
jgi:outer membrane receptor protein involved in Fe transport